jgi:catechol 2,3-dioxygenase-like lactoylglutathione lyase family enzyme
VNHVAISVPDCDAAVKWYTEILGFRNLRSVRGTSRSETPSAPIFKIYDGALQEVKIAWLGTGNSIGFEIFEFKDPKYKEMGKAGFGEEKYARGGFFHIGVTAPEPDAVCEKVVKAGGKKIGETVELFDGDTALYMQDPWGNVIEVLSCSFEQLMANRG